MSVTDTLLPPAEPDSPHEHDWRLVAVDYDEFAEVSELECSRCHATSYA